MNKINVLITRANGNLDSKIEAIKKAVKEAEQYVYPKLKVDWDIDLLVQIAYTTSSFLTMELADAHKLATLLSLR